MRYALGLAAIVAGLAGLMVGLLFLVASGMCEGDCGSGGVVLGVFVMVLGAGIVVGGVYTGFSKDPATRFDEHAKRFVARALEGVAPEVVEDVYAVSLFVDDEDDDHRRPTVTVGFNTEDQVARTEISETFEPLPPPDDPVWTDPGDPRWIDPAFLPGGTATDADEARWSYAFWLGNDLGILADTERDPQGARLREAWIRELGLWYSDEEEEANFDGMMEVGRQITPHVVELVVRLTQEVHADGTIARIFGRPIPVLTHEMEYDDEIAEQNLRANPDGLADDFARWIAQLKGA